jgi:hypothetical protein
MSVKNGRVFTYRIVYRCGHIYTVTTWAKWSKAEENHERQVAARSLCPRCEEREEKNVR